MPGGPPVRMGVADRRSRRRAPYAAIGILAALQRRVRDGKGSVVDVSMLDCPDRHAVLSGLISSAGRRRAGPQGPRPRLDPDLSLLHRARRPRRGAHREHRAHVARPVRGARPRRPDRDPRFASMAERNRHRADLVPLLEDAFRARATQRRLDRAIGSPAGVAAATVNTVDRALSDPRSATAAWCGKMLGPWIGPAAAAEARARERGGQPDQGRGRGFAGALSRTARQRCPRRAGGRASASTRRASLPLPARRRRRRGADRGAGPVSTLARPRGAGDRQRPAHRPRHRARARAGRRCRRRQRAQRCPRLRRGGRGGGPPRSARAAAGRWCTSPMSPIPTAVARMIDAAVKAYVPARHPGQQRGAARARRARGARLRRMAARRRHDPRRRVPLRDARGTSHA